MANISQVASRMASAITSPAICEDASNDPELAASVERRQLLLHTIAERIADCAKALLAKIAV
ncbi:MAG: hypothetical protein JXB30_12230 [Anaerolineae bacterium]|nr:hypothetical protein [Anaerolineae bacterium]